MQYILAIVAIAVVANAVPIELGHYPSPYIHAAPALYHGAAIPKAVVHEPYVSNSLHHIRF